MQNLVISTARKIWRPLKQRLGRGSRQRPYSQFISFKQTIREAKAAGLSVSDYIERRHATGQRTPLDLTMDGLAALGVFEGKRERVCEIGPGSGRYLEKTIARCHPPLYEIYETSREWRNWLVQTYGVVARACDGRTLAETETHSVDLAQAHKVFGGGLPFLNSVFYFRELARIVRVGGWVVFDIMTESCFDSQHLDAWFEADPWKWAWSPHIMPRDYAVQMFAGWGFELVGSFQVSSFPGVTECMAFRRKSDGPIPVVPPAAAPGTR